MSPQTRAAPDASSPCDAGEDFRAFYDEAPCGYLTMRQDGTILAANRRLLTWCGGDAAMRAGALHLRDILTPAGWVIFSIKCAPVLATHGRMTEMALELRQPDRPALSVLGSFHVAKAPGSDEHLTRCILFDATERRCYERDLLAARRAADHAHSRLSAILESTSDAVLLVGPDWRIAYANAAATLLHDGPLAGVDLRLSFLQDRDNSFLPAFEQAMEGGACEERHGLVGSAWYSVRAYATAGGGIAVFVRDTTRERLAAEDRLRHARQIEHLATHDALTGLPNRRLFASRLRDALAAGERPLAVMCLDLDGFKQVNDRLGHPVGDELLKAVAGRLRGALHVEDTVARLGGDEFAVLLTGDPGTPAQAGAAQAEAVARRIIARLSAPYGLSGNTAKIGVSIGITTASGQAASPDALLAEADLALYGAKRSGRGRHAAFDPHMMSEHRARLETGDLLRRGIEGGELLLHYQPIIRLDDQSVCGHEALIRWNRPGHGLVQPGDFIAVAEEAGLIGRLGDFVLSQACRDAAAWPDESLRIAVNVSPHQFRDPALVDTVARALDDSGLRSGRLELEITEGLLVERAEEVRATMYRLRALGVSLALDDFGTGFSSLAHLRSFPFDRVKLDRSFLGGAGNSPGDAAIIEAVARLCRKLGMTCVAEGVESEAQHALVREIGCGEAQGYLLGDPVPQSELLHPAHIIGGGFKPRLHPGPATLQGTA